MRIKAGLGDGILQTLYDVVDPNICVGLLLREQIEVLDGLLIVCRPKVQ